MALQAPTSQDPDSSRCSRRYSILSMTESRHSEERSDVGISRHGTARPTILSV